MNKIFVIAFSSIISLGVINSQRVLAYQANGTLTAPVTKNTGFIDPLGTMFSFDINYFSEQTDYPEQKLLSEPERDWIIGEVVVNNPTAVFTVTSKGVASNSGLSFFQKKTFFSEEG
jgi:hypothetical protein